MYARAGAVFLLFLGLCIHFSVAVAAVPTPRGADLSAQGAIVLCFETGEELFAYNADIPRAPASIVKMMPIYLALEAIEAGRFTMDCIVPISQRAHNVSLDTGQTNVRLTRTRAYTVREIIDVTSVVSAGGASIALAELVGGSEYGFFQMANDKVDEWGIHAFFQSASGGTLPTFLTPRAMAELTRNIITRFPAVLAHTGPPYVRFQGQRFNHHVPGRFPGMDGFKTGSNNTAGFNFAGTAQREGTRVISMVMGSTHPRRFDDTAILLNYGFYAIEVRRQQAAMEEGYWW